MSRVTTQWRSQEVHDEVAKILAENMAVAAKVIEVDARHNLLRVRKPEFGRAYRRVLALYRLTSQVVTEADEVTGQVGIPKGEKGGDYGFWIEVGSKAAAAQPWLRPALINNFKNILKLLVGK